MGVCWRLNTVYMDVWIMGRDDIYRDSGWLCFFLCLFMYVLVGVVYV